MSTNINSYSVALGLNASGLIDGSRLARGEAASLQRTFQSLVTPAERIERQLNNLENAYSKGAIKADTYGLAVGRLNAKLAALNVPPTVKDPLASISQQDTAAAVSGTALISGRLASLAAGYISVQAAAGFASSAIRKSADIEKAAASYEVLTGSAGKAKVLLHDIRDLASKGLSLGGMNKTAETMLGFNVAAQDIVPTLRRLGEITGGDTERMRMMGLAFSQASAAGRLMGQDLLQMINAGFNPLQEISRKTGRSLVDLKKDMEDGLITFAMVNDAFRTATEAGGLYEGRLEKIADTIAGSLNRAAAQYEMFQVAIGDAFSPAVQALANDFSTATREADSMADAVRSLSEGIAGLSGGLKDLSGEGLFEWTARLNGLKTAMRGFSVPLDLMRLVSVPFANQGATDEELNKSRLEAADRIRKLWFIPKGFISDQLNREIDDFLAGGRLNGVGIAAALRPMNMQTGGDMDQKADATSLGASPDMASRLKDLEHQINIQERGESIAEQIRMSEAGISDELIEQYVSLQQRLDFYKEQNEELKEQEQRTKNLERAAEQVRDKLLDPIQRLADEIMKLDDMKAAQFLTDEEWVKARNAAFNNSVKDIKIEAPKSLEIGSQEAYKFFSQRDNREQEKAVRAEQKAESERQVAAINTVANEVRVLQSSIKRKR